MKRDAKGRFIAGIPMTDLEKEAISQGLVEQARRVREELGEPTEGMKRCTVCGEMKRWHWDGGKASEYVMRKRQLKSGFRKYPEGACKKCAARRSAEYRLRLIERIGREGLKERQKGWNENRDPVKRRQYEREYGSMRRRQDGAAVRGPWKKYREVQKTEVLSAEPLVRWLEPIMQEDERLEGERKKGGMGREEGRKALDYNSRKAMERAKATGHISVEVADGLLTKLGRGEMLQVLYGEGVGDDEGDGGVAEEGFSEDLPVSDEVG